MEGEALNAIPCYALTFSDEELDAVFAACKDRGLPEDIDGIKALVMEAATGEINYEEGGRPDLAEMIKQYVNQNPDQAAKMLENSGLMLKGLAAPLLKKFMAQMKKAG